MTLDSWQLHTDRSSFKPMAVHIPVRSNLINPNMVSPGTWFDQPLQHNALGLWLVIGVSVPYITLQVHQSINLANKDTNSNTVRALHYIHRIHLLPLHAFLLLMYQRVRSYCVRGTFVAHDVTPTWTHFHCRASSFHPLRMPFTISLLTTLIPSRRNSKFSSPKSRCRI